MAYLDYSLKTPEERVACVADIIATAPKLTSTYKEYLADYLLFNNEKNQTKVQKGAEYPYTTKNRAITINKRQISYEQVVASLENGEDGIYALINQDKNQLLDNKDKLSSQDIEEIPGLKEQLDLITTLKQKLPTATGQKRYQIKKHIIETWQQIYILKASSSNTIGTGRTSNHLKSMTSMPIPEKITLDPNGNIQVDSPLSLLVPEHVMFLLHYYAPLKEESYEALDSDMHWLLIDLDNLVDKVLKDYPVLYDLLIWKIDGVSNEEIKARMEYKHGVTHNEQYYSTLWRKRIPKLISDQARKDWLIYHFSNETYGEWLYCNRCGQWKPAHPLFFSKNTSKSGYYSICKQCRQDKS